MSTSTPVVHLHGPVSGPVCGAPYPPDRKREMTAYRSEITCPDCAATLRPTYATTTVHYVTEAMSVTRPDGRVMWSALCSVNNQRAKPSTVNPELVTCLNCLDRLTRPNPEGWWTRHLPA